MVRMVLQNKPPRSWHDICTSVQERMDAVYRPGQMRSSSCTDVKRPTTSELAESSPFKRRKTSGLAERSAGKTSGLAESSAGKTSEMAGWEREPLHYPQLTPDELWTIVGMHLVFDSRLELHDIDRIIHLIAER